jgi:hypothetical protein
MSRRGRGGTPISLFSFQDIITSVTGIMILVTLFLALEVIRRKEGSPQNRTKVLTQELIKASEQAAKVNSTLSANRRQIEQLRSALAGDESQLLDSVKVDADEVARKLSDLDELNKLMASELSESEARRRETERQLEEMQSRETDKQQDKQTLEQLAKTVQAKVQELQKLRQANRVIFNPTQGDSKTPWLVEFTTTGILSAPIGKKEKPQSFPSVAAFKSWAAKRSKAGEYFVLLVKPSTIEKFLDTRENLEKQGFDVGFDLLKDDQTAIDPELGAASP